MSSPTGRHFLIEGRVQGVFYRRFTSQQAKALGLTGWVRNLPDGRVEAQAFGPPEHLDHLTRQLKKGPTAAKVTHITLTEIPYEAGEGFDVI